MVAHREGERVKGGQERGEGRGELFVWQVKFGAKALALLLARGFMNERSVAQIFDKSRECALTYAVVTSRFAPGRHSVSGLGVGHSDEDTRKLQLTVQSLANACAVGYICMPVSLVHMYVCICICAGIGIVAFAG